MSEGHVLEKNNRNKTVITVRSYVIGFVLSLATTLSAYIAVVVHQQSGHAKFSHELLIPFVLSFAVLQLIFQLLFFLHMAHESRPRWQLLFFISTILVVLMVVLGSVWIMYNLNYNMMPGMSNQTEYLMGR